ncbi:BioY family transporter [Litorivita pollutaquae]|uniref:Biotin transporter n=1 Tax=Litorivita pollutaquae TaxID=2200892 RepID=A0A2V4NQL4_9RHOB|nr:biotin transporter BioY [Litorivita pollutaquae]PYC46996.1 BioY family transporter [Litorivita pollutaquae]
MERNITLIALFAALIAALAMLPKFMLASGVPITAQSLGIMLAGTLLGPKRGALAVLLYLGLAAVGLPILAGGKGGLAPFMGITAGYLAGFVAAAFVAGLLAQKWREKGGAILPALAAFIGGIVVLHAFGIVGMAAYADVSLAAASVWAVPFLIGDAIKAVLAGLITQAVMRARPGLAKA